MAVNLQGQIIDEQGNPIGGQVDLKTGNMITGNDLSSFPALNFQTPKPPESFLIKDIPIPELPSTAPEKEATDLTKSLQALNERILGQSAFKTEQEKTLGVEGLRKTTSDLTNQLRALQAEAEATKISPEFEQRTTLMPFAEGERGRKLRDVGVRALIVGANLQAAQGNLASALDAVDRATAQKFDPIKEEIAVKKTNLDLILQSPEFSRADKERALKQKAIQDAEERKIKQQEETQKKIWETGVEAARGGANAAILRSIQNAATSEEALRFASPFIKEKLPSDIESFKQFFPDVDITTPQGRQQFLDWQTKQAETKRKVKELEISDDLVAQRLSSVGLTTAILTTNNKLTKGNLDRIVAKGVPPSVTELINQAILEGKTLEEIRQALKQGYGQDIGFSYLDKFMQTLQEKEQVKNPFK